jgi:MarR family transcriptional regulator, organic hydroperoxide resistance regulator
VQRNANRERGAGDADRAEAPALGDVLEFMRLIWGISHGLQSASKRMDAEFGVTGPQRLVIRILGRRPGAIARQLAETLHLDPSTLTGVLRRLEDRGLVERSPGDPDRRQAHFCLTPVGRAIDRRHAGTVEAAIRRVLATLDPRTIAAAAEVMRALEQALGGAQPRRRRRARAAR